MNELGQGNQFACSLVVDHVVVVIDEVEIFFNCFQRFIILNIGGLQGNI
jgi:hypothetical protein